MLASPVRSFHFIPAFFFFMFYFLQKDHPQNPIVREGCETDEDKLMRALGLGVSLVGGNGHSKGKEVKSSLSGYSGFLALLYAFTEQTNAEVSERFIACAPRCCCCFCREWWWC